MDSNSDALVETIFNRDLCTFESSQSEEGRAQSADSAKAYSKRRAFTVVVYYCKEVVIT